MPSGDPASNAASPRLIPIRIFMSSLFFPSCPSYYYPKTKTNMFVITRSLGKFSGDRRLSDSDMPLAKAQRRQVRREKTNILTKDFHVLSPTFAALASLREIFRVSVTVVRRRRTSFSQRSLGKSVYYYPKVFAACANYLRVEDSRIRTFLSPRRKDAK